MEVSWGWIGVRVFVEPHQLLLSASRRVQAGRLNVAPGITMTASNSRSTRSHPSTPYTHTAGFHFNYYRKKLVFGDSEPFLERKNGSRNVSQSHSGHQLTNAVHGCNTGKNTLILIRFSILPLFIFCEK